MMKWWKELWWSIKRTLHSRLNETQNYTRFPCGALMWKCLALIYKAAGERCSIILTLIKSVHKSETLRRLKETNKGKQKLLSLLFWKMFHNYSWIKITMNTVLRYNIPERYSIVMSLLIWALLSESSSYLSALFPLCNWTEGPRQRWSASLNPQTHSDML